MQVHHAQYLAARVTEPTLLCVVRLLKWGRLQPYNDFQPVRYLCGGALDFVCHPAMLQIMAAVRCKRSKWVFLARSFLGKDWKENELFLMSNEVRKLSVTV